MFLRTPYNYDVRAASLAAGFVPRGESLAVQSERDESDINTIVRRFGLTGRLPEDVRVPTFGDFTDAFDFQTAQNALVAARESFMAMPADVRTTFNNDPQRFVSFCSDEKNLDEMRKLGLAVPKEAAPVEPEPTRVVIVPGATPSATPPAGAQLVT